MKLEILHLIDLSYDFFHVYISTKIMKKFSNKNLYSLDNILLLFANGKPI